MAEMLSLQTENLWSKRLRRRFLNWPRPKTLHSLVNIFVLLYSSCTTDSNFVLKISVVGDPFGATTHTDLILRAKEAGVPHQVVHNASILNAVGCCGLQVTILNLLQVFFVFKFLWMNSFLVVQLWRNSIYSFLDRIMAAKQFLWQNWRQLATRPAHLMPLRFVVFIPQIRCNCKNHITILHYLDIKVKEQTVENMMKKRPVYEPPRFMTVQQAAEQLLELVAANQSPDKSMSN